jgi:hypothetical protein
MIVRGLIESLQALDGDTPIRLQSCLNTPNGQVFFSEDLDTVIPALDYGRNAGCVTLCNWDGPAVHLCDLTPVE